MCGRFVQAGTWAELSACLGLVGAPRNLRPRFNVAPTDEVEAVVEQPEGRLMVAFRWGLVPSWWAKPLKALPATFNARAETVASKPMFRSAFQHRRCVVPASGFFEWTLSADGKQPHFFSAADGGPLLFAGLWDRWTDPATGEALGSCTLIVSGASAWMAPYHDRMPVLLAPDAVGPWLDGSAGADALGPAPEEALRQWPVSKRVNRAGHADDPGLIAPEAPSGAVQTLL